MFNPVRCVRSVTIAMVAISANPLLAVESLPTLELVDERVQVSIPDSPNPDPPVILTGTVFSRVVDDEVQSVETRTYRSFGHDFRIDGLALYRSDRTLFTNLNDAELSSDGNTGLRLSARPARRSMSIGQLGWGFDIVTVGGTGTLKEQWLDAERKANSFWTSLSAVRAIKPNWLTDSLLYGFEYSFLSDRTNEVYSDRLVENLEAEARNHFAGLHFGIGQDYRGSRFGLRSRHLLGLYIGSATSEATINVDGVMIPPSPYYGPTRVFHNQTDEESNTVTGVSFSSETTLHWFPQVNWDLNVGLLSKIYSDAAQSRDAIFGRSSVNHYGYFDRPYQIEAGEDERVSYFGLIYGVSHFF